MSGLSNGYRKSVSLLKSGELSGATKVARKVGGKVEVATATRAGQFVLLITVPVYERCIMPLCHTL